MEIIQWSEKYSVGIKKIDNQHKGIVVLINELFNLMSQGKAKDSMNEIFNQLTDYTKKHFYTEEAMLIKFAYYDYTQHKEEHKKFISKLTDLHKDFDKGKVTISIEILNFLKDWLINHILISDNKYAPFILKQDF
ncbi:MAG: bacteriohemerythrin [Bacteroidales bacterium]|jgi:hemerythrin|nr:bacteriohemerythrin [Bacteroidales bacterium]